MDVRALVDGFDPEVNIERAWTPPSSWYTSQDVYDLERHSIFRNSWQPVARVEQLSEAGCYVAGCLAGEPYVVVRDDNQIRAFYNTCRHKGREVVTGVGRSEQLICGYHAWSYGLDGTLRKAPQMAGVQDFDRGQMSLVPLAVETWGPWMFINRGEDPMPLQAQLAPLDRELEGGGWADLKFAGSRSWTINCNWKVYIDNYLDGGYHIPHMHPTLDAQLTMSRYKTECFERYSVQSCPSAETPDDRIEFQASDRIGERANYVWIFPNFMINRYGPCLDSNHVVPVGPDQCRVEYQFFFRDTAGQDAERFIEESMKQSDVTQREDIAICESVQRGLHSESYERGRYAPKLEIGEHHFHRLLATGLREGLGSSTR